jgi:hypothetical protein
MAILQSFIAKQARPFGDHLSLKKQWRFCDLLSLPSDAFWRSPIAEKAMAFLQSFIAKQARPFGDQLSLNKRWQFGYILSLNMLRRFCDKQSLRVRGRFCNMLLLNIDWQFWQLLIAHTLAIDLVAFIRLEGVN